MDWVVLVVLLAFFILFLAVRFFGKNRNAKSKRRFGNGGLVGSFVGVVTGIALVEFWHVDSGWAFTLFLVGLGVGTLVETLALKR